MKISSKLFYDISAIRQTIRSAEVPFNEGNISGVILPHKSSISLSFTEADKFFQQWPNCQDTDSKVRNASFFKIGDDVQFKNKIKNSHFNSRANINGNSISQGLIKSIDKTISPFTFEQSLGRTGLDDLILKSKKRDTRFFAAGHFVQKHDRQIYLVGKAVINNGQVNSIEDKLGILESALKNHSENADNMIIDYMKQSRGGTIFGNISIYAQRYNYTLMSKSLDNETIHVIQGIASPRVKLPFKTLRAVGAKQTALKTLFHFLPEMVEHILPVTALAVLAVTSGILLYKNTHQA